MLSNKHILMSILCLSGLVHGAASHEVTSFDASSVPSSSERTLQLSDCFTSVMTRVPGQQRFYEPIAFGTSSDVSFVDRCMGMHTGSKMMCGVYGLVEGDDAEVTQQAAKLILASLPTWSRAELQHLENEEFSESEEFIDRIVSKSPQVKYLLHTKCNLRIFQSRDNAREPIACCTGLNIESTLLPKGVCEALNKIERYFNLNLDGKGRVAGLAAYAATLSVSHEAPFLQLDYERYAQFLKQEFGD